MTLTIFLTPRKWSGMLHPIKILALFCLLPSLALAGLPTPEEEIATLKAEYAR